MIKLQSIYAILGRLSKREKLILYTALFVVSLTLLDRLIITPIFSRMKTLDEEIEGKKSEIKSDLYILAHKDRILNESKQYSSFFEKPKADDEEMTSILKEIEGMASSIYLVDLKPVGIEDVGVSRIYSVNLNCEAHMDSLIQFMYNIESSSELLTINNYQINPKSKDSSIARCRMTISKITVP